VNTSASVDCNLAAADCPHADHTRFLGIDSEWTRKCIAISRQSNVKEIATSGIAQEIDHVDRAVWLDCNLGLYAAIGHTPD
jgi:hypothetical protein